MDIESCPAHIFKQLNNQNIIRNKEKLVCKIIEDIVGFLKAGHSHTEIRKAVFYADHLFYITKLGSERISLFQSLSCLIIMTSLFKINCPPVHYSRNLHIIFNFMRNAVCFIKQVFKKSQLIFIFKNNFREMKDSIYKVIVQIRTQKSVDRGLIFIKSQYPVITACRKIILHQGKGIIR